MGGGLDLKKVKEIMEGKKYDGGKAKLYLLPPKSILEVGKVLTYGADKYDAENWRKVDAVSYTHLTLPTILLV